ncbi:MULTISPECIES: Fic/DOC family protein [unclassified Lebetimonas]|uniref:Fic/DOC family protein n=1 Tax=unclassified Lebetimonas TaxID=2648158 RepID=UPI00046717E7|nr:MULTISPECIES: Fic family protein [unclassified Lebetimonas]
MSKYTFKISDIYYSNTSIPKNKLDIKDENELIKIEHLLLLESYEKFAKKLDVELDEYFFKNLHKKTFQDLYEWAGVYRDVDIAKGDTLFCRGIYVTQEMKKIFAKLKKDKYLKNLDKETFAHKLAYYKCELIAIHPFLELNGRIIRFFIDILSINAGYDVIDYANITEEEYIKCAIECVQNANYDCFEEIIKSSINKF